MHGCYRCRYRCHCLNAEGVKASPDNVAKAKYLVYKLKMERADVEAAFKACGMAMPELPAAAAKAKEPEDAAKDAREARAASLEEKK